MQLSKTEEKMVALLRKKRAQIVRWRWFMVFTGILLLASSCYGLFTVLTVLEQPDLNSVMILASFSPQIYLFAVLGTAIIGYAWANWNGNPQETLLLRLIDEKHDT